MHGHVMSWWRGRHGGRQLRAAGAAARVTSRHWGGGGRHGTAAATTSDESEGFGGGPFGVRRPLRFLAYKLELDEKQVAELARILDDLKTERAQGEVDRRRSLSGFADAVAGETFDAARAKESAALRVATAERLRDAVIGGARQAARPARQRPARAPRLPDPNRRPDAVVRPKVRIPARRRNSRVRP